MLKRIFIPSPNFSVRTSSVRLIVLHTAEGARTIEDLGHFFSTPKPESSHCGADDTPGTVAQYVADTNKAWSCAAYNSASVNLELCAFAAWTTGQWMLHPNMLANCAAWIAEEALRFDIPITELTDAEAQGSGRGVCQHKQLGAAGGGHTDCGPGFPIDHVLTLARGSGPALSDPHHYLYHPSSRPNAAGLRGGPFEVEPGRKVDERERIISYDKARQHRLLHRKGLVVIQRDLGALAQRLLGIKGGAPWPVDHRHLEVRYKGLLARSKGEKVV